MTYGSVMVERQVQSVGDFFQEKVDSLVHQMHSCRLGDQIKLELASICLVNFTILFITGSVYRDLVEISKQCLWTCVKEL